MTEPTASTIDAVILAGGQGSRVGYRQKALLTYRGETLLTQVMRVILPQVASVWVSANQQLPDYWRYTPSVFPDVHSGFLGPLAGMEAAWQSVETDWLVFVPCDNPHMPDDLVNRLIQSYQNQPAPLVAAFDGDRLQPLYLMMHRSMRPALEDAIAKQHLSVVRWIQDHEHALADFSDCDPLAFQNLNTLSAFEENT